ncbi:YicC family protein [Pelagovum pacificum]|uniref:YicC family protein n=2 Tax=Pelagovum pacificum TaxID=2588711 RepID=A0A5C5GJH5_9RHOB|nr:YicC family protein [Pelagovum pacificum]TNY34287.1 YicC family protein [Pelagovum pacificum]
MTAFASRRGAHGAMSWTWELRSVNGRGLDLRLRLPDGVPGLEPLVRGALTGALTRGNVTVNLRLQRDTTSDGLTLDEAQLGRVLTALAQVEARALDEGLTLAQPTPADVLGFRGVVGGGEADEDPSLLNALKADLDATLEEFLAMRADEGAALYTVLRGQIDQIDTLATEAAAAAADRLDETRESVRAALNRVLEETRDVDEDRLAQELALIAIKQDVTEEIDRLRAHVEAARKLLDDPKPAGRRLDFLAQEFNREANTICSKSQSRALTAVGLELKAAIEQMREQVQNVE